jgi:hypothetical protein
VLRLEHCFNPLIIASSFQRYGTKAVLGEEQAGNCFNPLIIASSFQSSRTQAENKQQNDKFQSANNRVFISERAICV